MWRGTIGIVLAVIGASAEQTDIEGRFASAGKQLAAAQYAEAERSYRELVQLLSRAQPPDRRFATALNQLGSVLHYTGRYAEAEKSYRHALAVAAAQKSEIDPGAVMNNLAALYRRTARYDEAEKIHRELLATRESQYGPHSLQVALTLINLADLLRTVQRDAEGEPLGLRAIEILETHPDAKARGFLADALHTVGSMCERGGRLADAAQFYERSVSIREELLGPGHPRTAASVLSLAGLRSAQGLDHEAEPLFHRSIRALEKAGATHPDLATACNNYGQMLKRSRRFEEAEAQLRRALDVWERAFGTKHPDYGAGLANLADLFVLQGKLNGAAKLYQQALAVLRPRLGRANPTVTGIENIVATLAKGRERSNDTVDYRQLLLESRR